MGHKGPVLRSRCIGPGRARTQLLFLFNAIKWPSQIPLKSYLFIQLRYRFTTFLARFQWKFAVPNVYHIADAKWKFFIPTANRTPIPQPTDLYPSHYIDWATRQIRNSDKSVTHTSPTPSPKSPATPTVHGPTDCSSLLKAFFHPIFGTSVSLTCEGVNAGER